jgi:transcriptional regulator with XRE-family HTH domain
MARPKTAPVSKNGDHVDLAEWGRRIADRRRQLGLLQVELAEKIHVTQDTISRLEHGKRPPTDHQRIELARALRTPIWLLFPYPLDVS